MKISEFRQLVFDFYLRNGRHFPWRETQDPYAITVSELMLQQTQTERVIPKYENFLKALPDWSALAEVSVAELLTLWQGLGYNRRALSLKRLAELIVRDYNGTLPANRQTLEALPGIGPYTAGAILIFAFNQPEVIIETNIRRVFLHHFFKDQQNVADKELLPLITKTVDHENPREWYYALMDYGARLAKEVPNPNRRSAHYTKQSTFTGSNRQLRGQILRLLVEHGRQPKTSLLAKLDDPDRGATQLAALAQEGFLILEEDAVYLPEKN